MPLHPVVGRPEATSGPGLSLAAHVATRELPTAGPWAKFAQKSPPTEAEAEEAMTTTTTNSVVDPSLPVPSSSGDAATETSSDEPAVLVRGLNFSYPDIDGRPLAGVAPVVTDMNLTLPRGSRCLLLGANGAGKTTLLKVLGGKHLVPRGAVAVLGKSPFHDTGLASSGSLSYLGGNWERDVAFAGFSVPLAADFAAGEMLSRAASFDVHGSKGGVVGVGEQRMKTLIDVLDIDPEWRMHRVSDGQRRRVQIAMGLLKPFDVLLLDEITVDLDVLGRADLMRFLTDECDRRGATVIYATHIFDGLDAWPTHVAFLARGKLRRLHVFDELREELEGGRLLELVEGWLRHEEAEAEAEAKEEEKSKKSGGFGSSSSSSSARGGAGAGNDGCGVASWSNGWAAGRMTSTLKNSSNAVMRM